MFRGKEKHAIFLSHLFPLSTKRRKINLENLYLAISNYAKRKGNSSFPSRVYIAQKRLPGTNGNLAKRCKATT